MTTVSSIRWYSVKSLPRRYTAFVPTTCMYQHSDLVPLVSVIDMDGDARHVIASCIVHQFSCRN